MTSKKDSEGIFNRAVELCDPAKQAAFLEEACGGERSNILPGVQMASVSRSLTSMEPSTSGTLRRSSGFSPIWSLPREPIRCAWNSRSPVGR